MLALEAPIVAETVASPGISAVTGTNAVVCPARTVTEGPALTIPGGRASIATMVSPGCGTEIVTVRFAEFPATSVLLAGASDATVTVTMAWKVADALTGAAGIGTVTGFCMSCPNPTTV